MAIKVLKAGKRLLFSLTYLEALVTFTACNRDKKSLRQLIRDAINLYELHNHETIRLLRERLSSRLNADYGISRAMIIELKLLYIYLGHYLQKIGEEA